jgi:hypothetical protein
MPIQKNKPKGKYTPRYNDNRIDDETIEIDTLPIIDSVENPWVVEEEILFPEKDENDFKNNKKYTSMCKEQLTEGECSRETCNFAHSYEQLRRNLCKFDKRCKNKRCFFKHTGEDPKDFFKRNNLLNESKNLKNQLKSYIIKCDDDDDKKLLEIIRISRLCNRKSITIVFKD